MRSCAGWQAVQIAHFQHQGRCVNVSLKMALWLCRLFGGLLMVPGRLRGGRIGPALSALGSLGQQRLQIILDFLSNSIGCRRSLRVLHHGRTVPP